MIEDDDLPARTTYPLHLSHDRERVRHDADDVWCVHDIERVVGEPEIGCVHLEQTDVVHLLADAARVLEHRGRQVDARYRAAARVERDIDACPDADLEHRMARLKS